MRKFKFGMKGFLLISVFILSVLMISVLSNSFATSMNSSQVNSSSCDELQVLMVSLDESLTISQRLDILNRLPSSCLTPRIVIRKFELMREANLSPTEILENMLQILNLKPSFKKDTRVIEVIGQLYLESGMYVQLSNLFKRSLRTPRLLELVGDMSYRTGNFERAQELYQEALSGSLNSPICKVTPSVIELKLKLAEVLTINGEFQRAYELLSEVSEDFDRYVKPFSENEFRDMSSENYLELVSLCKRYIEVISMLAPEELEDKLKLCSQLCLSITRKDNIPPMLQRQLTELIQRIVNAYIQEEMFSNSLEFIDSELELVKRREVVTETDELVLKQLKLWTLYYLARDSRSIEDLERFINYGEILTREFNGHLEPISYKLLAEGYLELAKLNLERFPKLPLGITEFERHIPLTSSSVVIRAGVSLEDKRVRRAISYWRAYLEYYPQRPEIWEILGDVYVLMGEYELAFENYYEGYRACQTDVLAYKSGSVAQILGKRKLALELLGKLKDTDNKVLRMRALWKLKRLEIK